MKIFFLMRSSLYVRYYESFVRQMAERGHQIHLGLLKIDEIYAETAVAKLTLETPGASYTVFPKREREWLWRRPAEFIRGLQTYVRFLDQRYHDAGKLRARAASLVPGPIRWPIEKFVGRDGKNMWSAIKFLRTIERSIPLHPSIVNFFESERPDLFLVTPLVDLRATQLDWLKCAKALNVRSGLCVASWDNLSNKSLIQGEPDAVFVWNKIQQQEAIELHQISPSKIFVTGAQCYDRLFARQPSASGAEFLSKVGLQAEHPYLLYLCSSKFIAPYEVDFVAKWIECLRISSSPLLKSIGILVRPHPQNACQWKDVDFTRYGNVAIYPRQGDNPIGGDSLNDFFDSMYYSVAAVGINTSVMIESGILNKPVFTILSPEFRNTQEGTLHFHHLVKGGLLNISYGLDQHVEQLSQVLAGGEYYQARIKHFIQNFVRPHGIEVECTPIFVRAVEDLEHRVVSDPIDSSGGSIMVRILLFPWAALSYTYKKAKEKSSKGRLLFNLIGLNR
ncbi:MAG: hypothetical protein P8X90_35515 [Desulfobacterales bacterium]